MALTQVFAALTRPSATKLNESSIPVVTATGDISAPYAGQIIFNSSDKRLYRYTGSAWVVYTGGPTWAMTRAAALSLANNAYTSISWDTEQNDTGNMHTTGANGDRVTINQAGLYAIATKGGFAPNATGIRGTKFTLNGTGIDGSAVLTNNSGGTFATAVVVPTIYVQCIVGDILRVQQFQNSGGALNTATGSIEDYPVFTGAWLHD